MEFERIEELLDNALKQVGEKQSIESTISFKGENVYQAIHDKLLEDKLIKRDGGSTLSLTVNGRVFEGYVNQKNRREGNLNRLRQLDEQNASLSFSQLKLQEQMTFATWILAIGTICLFLLELLKWHCGY